MLKQYEPTRYELEFKSQLAGQIRMLKKVDSSREMTQYRHDLPDWYTKAIGLYLIDPKKTIITKEFGLLMGTFKVWHRSLGWKRAQDKAKVRLGIIMGILAAAPEKVFIDREVEKIKIEYRVRDVIVPAKIPWKWIGAGGVALLAVGFMIPKLGK